MAKVDWPTRFSKMRSRGNRQSIEIYIRISKDVAWWEIIKFTEPTEGNCRYWDEKRRDFEAAAQKGSVNYRDYFPAGRNAKKVAHLQGDDKTIREWLRLYLDDLKKPRLKPRSSNTIKTSTRIVENQLTPKFGDMHLTELKLIDVVGWIDKQNLTQKAIDNKLTPLRWCYKKATRKGLIETDIFFNGNPEADKESTYVKDAFTPSEIEKILNVDMPAHIKNMIVFWLFSGLRTGEITGLKWSKWDKVNNTILINEVRRDGKQEDGAKTQAGTRKFDLMPQALDALKAQEKITKFGTLTNHETLMFVTDKGYAWEYEFADLWAEILKTAKVKYRKPYNMRHTFATMKLSYEGIDRINRLSHDLGHEEVKTTKKSYVDYELVNLDWSGVYRMVL